jgi:transmembrane sensor
VSTHDTRKFSSEVLATTEESDAAEWVAVRQSEKNWTEEQQAQLDSWLSRSVANRVAYVRLNATWRRTDRLVALGQPMRPSAKKIASSPGRWMRIAGAMCVVAALGVFATNYLQQPRPQLVQTPKGGQERLTLLDGSQIELNTDSAVLVDIGDRSRAVELVRGEALFQIRHDASRPFVVTVGARRIVDLGTKFLVRTSPDMTKIALIEGSARLEDADKSKNRAVVLTPGEVAIATTSAVRVSKHTSRELSESLSWQHGSVVFHNEPLADAAAELNRYGGPELVIADSETGKMMINGTFLTNNTEEFADTAHELFGLRVERQNGSLVLSR